MACNNIKNSNCGCGGKALTTIEDYEGYVNCNTEECSELWSDKCIINTSGEKKLEKDGYSFTINANERIFETIEKLIHLSSGENDVDIIPTGIKVVDLTSSSIKISYTELSNKNISIYYKKNTESEYKTDSMSSNTYTINDCVSKTKYNIYIKNETDDKQSLVLNITTK